MSWSSMISKHETVNDSTASFALALKIGYFFFNSKNR